jgi:hypothetical protein
MYIQYQASKELGIDKRDIVFYALCLLYILSVVTVALDATRIILDAVSKSCIRVDHYNIFSIDASIFRSSIRVSAPDYYFYSTLAMRQSQ